MKIVILAEHGGSALPGPGDEGRHPFLVVILAEHGGSALPCVGREDVVSGVDRAFCA
jgi:hypothetical protein